MREGSLATRLRVLRARQGLKLTDAAKKTGVTRHTLASLERGGQEPHFDTLLKLAQGYGVDVEDLLEEPVPLAEAPQTGPIGVELEDLHARGIPAGQEDVEILNRCLEGMRAETREAIVDYLRGRLLG